MRSSREPPVAFSDVEKAVEKPGEGPADEPAKSRHPMDSASPLAKIWFAWLTGALRRWSKDRVTIDDVFELPESDRCALLRDRYLRAKAQHPKYSLLRLLFSLFWRRWAIAGCCYVVWCTSAGCQPEILRRLVRYIQHETDESVEEGITHAVFLVLANIGYFLSITWKFHQSSRNGVCIRGLVTLLLYEKSLRLNLNVDANDGIGTATNLMSNDTEQLFLSNLFTHYIWLSPMFVLIVFIWMCYELGFAAAVGFGLLVLSIPLNGAIGKAVGSTKRKMMKETDERTNVVAQILNGIQVVKCYAWEDALAARLEAMRDKELAHLWTSLLLRRFSITVQFVLPTLISFATLATYVALGNTLKLETVVITLSFINVLRFPTLLIPHAISLAFEALVALQRIEAFLSLPEATGRAMTRWRPDTDGGDHSDEGDDGQGVLVRLRDASFHYAVDGSSGDTHAHADADADTAAAVNADADADTDTASEQLTSAQSMFHMHGLDLRVRQGALVGVVGRVGAGKSSLLLGLLAEMRSAPEGSTQLKVAATEPIAYAAQTAAIVNGTVRENVVFGLEDDEESYQRCLEAACLTHDLKLLVAGDRTELGEKGVNLSGKRHRRMRSIMRVILPVSPHLTSSHLISPSLPLSLSLKKNAFSPSIASSQGGKKRG